MSKYKSMDDWLEELGKRESSGNYAAVNPYGYLGKYQMGGGALADSGYYKLNPYGSENDWLGQFTGKDNVYSKNDFLNNPQAQENAIRDYMKKQWGYVKHYGYDKYLDSSINGIKITPSGLLAGMHLVGHGGLNKYFKNNGQKKVADKNGTSVEEYMKKYGGYDVSELIDPNYYAPKIGGTKAELNEKILNQGADILSGVAKQVMPPMQVSGKALDNVPIQPPLSEAEWRKRIRRMRMGVN